MAFVVVVPVIDSAPVGKVNVQHHEIARTAEIELQRIGRALQRTYFVSLRRQSVGEQRANIRVVIDDENPHTHQST